MRRTPMPQPPARPRSSKLPLAPIFIVLLFLGPLHLSTVDHSSLNNKQPSGFLDRKAFQERRGGSRRVFTDNNNNNNDKALLQVQQQEESPDDATITNADDREDEVEPSDGDPPLGQDSGKNSEISSTVVSEEGNVASEPPATSTHRDDVSSHNHLDRENPSGSVGDAKPQGESHQPLLEQPKDETTAARKNAPVEATTPHVDQQDIHTPAAKPPPILRLYQHSDLGNNNTQEQMQLYERLSPKSSFDVALRPLFNVTAAPPGKKIKILYFTQKLGSGKVQHVFLDGFHRSDYIDLLQVIPVPGGYYSLDKLDLSNLTYVDQGEDLWVDDSPNGKCPQMVHYAKQQTRPIPILQLDYKDFSSSLECPELQDYMGIDMIRYVKRSIVEDRKFNWTSNWIDHGHYINNSRNILHSPYTVRTDQVNVIQRLLQTITQDNNVTSPVDWPEKRFDIAHFWGVGMDPVSKLRNRITEIVKSFDGLKIPPPNNNSTTLPKTTTLKCYARTAGSRGTEGRRKVQELYVKTMMKSRIVVVTQRDPWEGHYRLMEALAGGVMVVADFMLSLPRGLVDRESVVLFRSEAELREVLLYYATHEDKRRAIAQRGWEIAMGRHRSWHRMEEVLFGRPLTDVDNPYGPYKFDASKAGTVHPSSKKPAQAATNVVPKPHGANVSPHAPHRPPEQPPKGEKGAPAKQVGLVPEQQSTSQRLYQRSDLGNITETQHQIYERLSTKSSFDVALRPMFNVTPGKKIKILYFTQKLGSGKVNHVFLDGFNRSNYIDLLQIIVVPGGDYSTKAGMDLSNLTYVDQGEDLWVDDSPNSKCPQMVHYAKQQTRPIPILQLDYKDFSRSLECPALQDYMGIDMIRYVKRSIVEDRKFNWTSNWIDHGHYINNSRNILHSPYTVRTDQVNVIQQQLATAVSTIASPVDWHGKKFDIAHFWGIGMDPVSKLRNRVTEIVKSFDNLKVSNEKRLKCYTNVAGSRGTDGRRNIQEVYVKIMMKSRIVVVTQRDPWEGHYRLMEALAGGVMVVADFMLSLPKGLVDRESVVLFRSEAELREVLLYYTTHDDERLAIAQRGWEIAMGRHRSWHRMEEILFGQPLTDVDNPYGPYKKGG